MVKRRKGIVPGSKQAPWVHKRLGSDNAREASFYGGYTKPKPKKTTKIKPMQSRSISSSAPVKPKSATPKAMPKAKATPSAPIPKRKPRSTAGGAYQVPPSSMKLASGKANKTVSPLDLVGGLTAVARSIFKGAASVGTSLIKSASRNITKPVKVKSKIVSRNITKPVKVKSKAVSKNDKVVYKEGEIIPPSRKTESVGSKPTIEGSGVSKYSPPKPKKPKQINMKKFNSKKGRRTASSFNKKFVSAKAAVKGRR